MKLSERLEHECRVQVGMRHDHLAILLDEAADLARRVEGAPVAIMDTRDVLGLCAPSEEDFPSLYALQGKRVALVPLEGE